MPKVSVILPSYNHAPFLPDSLSGILRQTHGDLELIIVDDCSSDDSWDVISRFARDDARIRAIRHEQNQGLSKSRNDGLRVATGEFIAFCDSDDVWERDKLSTQVALLQDNRGFDVAYCDTIIIDENGVPTGKRFSELFPLPKNPSGWLFLDLVKKNFINIQSVLMRKECVSEVQFFDERIEWIQDWWCWLRLSRKHRFLYSARPLARYRMHGDSTNLRHKRSYSLNRFRAFRRMLREYSELPRAAKANIIFRMGVDLCDLGRYRHGQRLLWEAIGLSMTDMRAFNSLCKAARRLVLYATARRPRKGTVTRG